MENDDKNEVRRIASAVVRNEIQDKKSANMVIVSSVATIFLFAIAIASASIAYPTQQFFDKLMWGSFILGSLTAVAAFLIFNEYVNN